MKISALFFVITIPLIFFSCSTGIYLPHTLPSPKLEAQGDLKVDLGMQGDAGLVPESYEIKSAYAITDHLGIMANGNYMRQNINAFGNEVNGYFLEAGMGLFDALDNNDFNISIYGGMGVGETEEVRGEFTYWDLFSGNLIQSRPLSFSGNYQQYFIQPNCGIHTDIMDLSYGFRASIVRFDDWHLNNGSEIIEQRPFNFYTLEANQAFSIGYKAVKFYINTGIIVFYNQYDLDLGDSDIQLRSLGETNLTASIGTTINLSTKK